VFLLTASPLFSVFRFPLVSAPTPIFWAGGDAIFFSVWRISVHEDLTPSFLIHPSFAFSYPISSHPIPSIQGDLQAVFFELSPFLSRVPALMSRRCPTLRSAVLSPADFFSVLEACFCFFIVLSLLVLRPLGLSLEEAFWGVFPRCVTSSFLSCPWTFCSLGIF